MPLNNRTLWFLAALAGAVGLYLYSRSKQGAAAVDSATSGTLDYIDMTATRIENFVTSRGYRNNNPGNLRYLASNPWNGQVRNDNGYGVYDTPQNGTRALGHQLRVYAARGLCTARSIVGTWAPPSENRTEAYVADVASQLAVGTDEPFDVELRLPELATAIAKHENGYLDSAYDFSWVYLP